MSVVAGWWSRRGQGWLVGLVWSAPWPGDSLCVQMSSSFAALSLDSSVSLVSVRVILCVVSSLVPFACNLVACNSVVGFLLSFGLSLLLSLLAARLRGSRPHRVIHSRFQRVTAPPIQSRTSRPLRKMTLRWTRQPAKQPNPFLQTSMEIRLHSMATRLTPKAWHKRSWTVSCAQANSNR